MAASSVVHSGNDGVFQIDGNALQKIISFEITEEEGSTSRVDGMGDTSEDTVLHKTKWSGSLSCRLLQSDTTGAPALRVGSEITISAYPDGDISDYLEISGLARVSSISMPVDQESDNRITIQFTGKGDLTRGVAA